MKTNLPLILVLITLISSILVGSTSVRSDIQPMTVTDESTFVASSNLVNPRSQTELIVTVINNSAPLSGVDVIFVTPAGKINPSGLTTDTVVTNASGVAQITWIAPDLAFNDIELNVNITAEIQSIAGSTFLYQNIVVRHLDTSAIVNSELLIPNVVLSGSKFDIFALVKDSNGNPTPNMQVTFTELTALGGFNSSAQTLTNSTGYANVTWTAPTLGVNDTEFFISMEAFVEAGPLANITIAKEFFVRASVSDTLDISISAVSELVSSGSTTILIEVQDNAIAVDGANITLSVDSGEFSNQDTLITLSTNSTGFVKADWTAPNVVLNTTVTIEVSAFVFPITSVKTVDIQVYPAISSFDVSVSLNGTSVNQDDSLKITVTVLDDADSSPVTDATVVLALEAGIWEESGTESYSTSTNPQGVVTAIFDGSPAILILAQQTFLVSITVQKDNFETNESSVNFIVIRRPDTFNFTASLGSASVQRGDTISISLFAEKNGFPWVEATFRITATAGQFVNGLADISNKTDANGELTLVWDSSPIPASNDPLTLFFVVQLVNSGLGEKTLQFTLNPPTDTNTQTIETVGDGDNGSPLSNPLLLGGIAGVVVLGGVALYFTRKS